MRIDININFLSKRPDILLHLQDLSNWEALLDSMVMDKARPRLKILPAALEQRGFADIRATMKLSTSA